NIAGDGAAGQMDVFRFDAAVDGAAGDRDPIVAVVAYDVAGDGATGDRNRVVAGTAMNCVYGGRRHRDQRLENADGAAGDSHDVVSGTTADRALHGPARHGKGVV